MSKLSSSLNFKFFQLNVFSFNRNLSFNGNQSADDGSQSAKTLGFPNYCRYIMPGLVLALAACGGGGGGGSSSPTNTGGTSPAPEPAPFEPTVASLDINQFIDHPEYQGQVGLAVTKAANAYARGLTGDGVRLGFTDTGLDDTHPEFEAARIYMNDREQLSGMPATNTQLDHGTTVASIAAGARGVGAGMHGVAYEADIGMYTLALNADDNLEISDAIFNSGLTRLAANNTDIYNHSWGLTIQLDPAAAGTQLALLQSEYSTSIQTIAATPGLHVWSAGNEGGDEVSLSAALPLFFDQLEGRVLVVAAVDEDGLIGADSNKCGQAKSFCLAAPGGHNPGSSYVLGARAGGGYQSVVGTSFAAPHVAAALSLMKELFGTQMTDAEIAERLLQTADSSGIYADQNIYGHGLLDIDAATNPVGPSHVISGGKKINVDESAFDFSHIDEALLEKLKEQKIVVHDSLGAPFQMPLSVFTKASPQIQKTSESAAFLAQVPAARNKAALTQRNTFVSTWSAVNPGHLVGLVMAPEQSVRPTIMRNPYMGLVESAMVTQISNTGMQITGVLSSPDTAHQNRQAGLVAHYSHFTAASSLSVQAGLMLEEHAWLGNHGKGVFSSRGRGQNLFVGVGGGKTLTNGWTSALGIYAGLSTHHAAQTGQLMQVKDMTSFAFEYTMSRPAAGGIIYTRLGQPLRIEKGSITMHLPVARLPGGGQVFEDVHLDLSPKGRLLDWRLGFIGQASAFNSFGIEMHITDNTHRPGADMTQMRFAGSWRMRF